MLQTCRSCLPGLALAALAACSPTFNWREVPVGDAGLVALLPCKPDRASRQLPLGAESVAVEMVGCEAGDATFAVASAHAADATQAGSWMHAWQAATRSQLAGIRITESAATLPRAAASPTAARLDTPDPAPPKRDGSSPSTAESATAPMHVLWFAQRDSDGSVTLYQATVLGKPSSAEARSTFFEGLRLP